MPHLLQDEAIIVRPHEPQDVDPIYLAVKESIAEISPWLPWCHPGISRDEIAAFVEFSRKGWADGSQHQFVILDASTGGLLGGISLSHIVKSNRLANMGYWVRTSAVGRGIATRAVRLVAQCGFQSLDLSRIEIAAIPDNRRSVRVAQRSGATREGLARNRLVMHGRAYDAELYSLVPSDLLR
jgi:RimJ/RimL family protein N-acetyltransferase